MARGAAAVSAANAFSQAGGSSRAAAGGSSLPGTELPRIKSPYNVQQPTAGLAATTLAPEEARMLYGAQAVPGLGDDDLAAAAPSPAALNLPG